VLRRPTTASTRPRLRAALRLRSGAAGEANRWLASPKTKGNYEE